MKEIKLFGDRLVIGKDALNYIEGIESSRVFIVVGGNSVFANGTIYRIQSMLEHSGKEFEVFRGVTKNPDSLIVLEGLKRMNEFKPDVVLALGGGSPIDAAKFMTLLYDYPEIDLGMIEDREISGLKRKTGLIAVPTTSGTGSEVTRAAVIMFENESRKVGIRSDSFLPDIAILDAQLTMTMPRNIAAETGMDALTHALETYMNHDLDDITECLSRGAIEGLLQFLPSSVNDCDPVSREKVHTYQSMAGMAFHNVGLGMAHGIAHAFGGKYNLSHGLLNGVLLPYVIAYNSRNAVVERKLGYLAEKINVADLVGEVAALNDTIGIPKSLKDMGISESVFMKDLDELVEKSLEGPTRINPIPMTHSEMEKFLISVFYGNYIEKMNEV